MDFWDPTMRLNRNIFAVLILVLAPQLPAAADDVARSLPNAQSAQTSPATGASDADAMGELKPQAPDTDLFVLMTGTCSTLKVAGRDFACRTVAFAHSVQGRAYFTVALDDPSDQSHIISFSGEITKRSNDTTYDLTIDQMLLNSKSQPKADGLPVPAVVKSAGRCVQLGSLASGHISSVVCAATDKGGRKYDLRFESDGSPITVRHVNPSAPTIRQSG
jgi:hypothetical protein